MKWPSAAENVRIKQNVINHFSLLFHFKFCINNIIFFYFFVLMKKIAVPWGLVVREREIIIKIFCLFMSLQQLHFTGAQIFGVVLGHFINCPFYQLRKNSILWGHTIEIIVITQKEPGSDKTLAWLCNTMGLYEVLVMGS